MMAGNTGLGQAKKAKQDEFYTQLHDIEAELRHYREQFRGKVVFCNCDDPYESNFFKYFALSFNFLGLKKLIATCYIGSPIANTQLSLFDDEPPEDKTTRAPHKIEIVEVADENGDGAFDLADVEYLLANRKNVLTRLKGDGDFRSPECVALLQEADIIVTNPPFSLFREYVSQLIESQKQFLIVGNFGAISYKEIFPLIRDNKMWLGYGFQGGNAYFRVPEEVAKREFADGVYNPETGLVKFRNCCWFTLMDIGKRHERLTLYKRYTPAEFPHYDNYDAIEVSKVSELPRDWKGAMGVPITFLDKYNPEQFEILAITKTWCGAAIKKYPEQVQVDKSGRKSKVSKLNDGAVIKVDSPPTGQTYYMVDGEYYMQTYPRIIIRRIGDAE